LEVYDFGKGFELSPQLRKAKEKPKKVRGNGLLNVFNTCNKLYNNKTENSHVITAVIYQQPAAKLLPKLEEYHLTPTSDYSHFKNDSGSIFLLKVNLQEISNTNSSDLEHHLSQLSLSEKFKTFILDITNVTYVCSAGWGVIFDSDIFSDFKKNRILIIDEYSTTGESFYAADFDVLASEQQIDIYNTIDEVLNLL